MLKTARDMYDDEGQKGLRSLYSHPENTYEDKRFSTQLSPNSLTNYFLTHNCSQN